MGGWKDDREFRHSENQKVNLAKFCKGRFVGQTIVSIVKRGCPLLRGFKTGILGNYEASFMRGCPFLRGSFFGGSTIIEDKNFKM